MQTVQDSHETELIEALCTADKLRYIQSISADDIASPCLLSADHQAFFCMLREYAEGSYQDVMLDYAANPVNRAGHWQDLKKHIEISGTAAQQFQGMTYNQLKDNFDKVVEPMKQDASFVTFSNMQGFAYFHTPKPATDIPDLPQGYHVSGLSHSSSDAVFYYGFNLGKNIYIQNTPIAVLADTYGLYIHDKVHIDNTRPLPYALARVHMELDQLDSNTPQQLIEKGVKDFLIKHELGHDGTYQGNAPVQEMLRSFDLDEKTFYEPRFPTKEDLGSWKRVRNGQGQPKDILFLLGDFIANMAILNTELSPQSMHTLRAFNFWLGRERTETYPPRGTRSFLAHSYDYQPELYINDLARLVDISLNKPETLANEMRSFDKKDDLRVIGLSSITNQRKNYNHD